MRRSVHGFFGKYDWVAIIVHAVVWLPSLIFVLAVILGLLQRLDGSFSSACDRRLAPRKCVVWHRDTGYQADKIAQALVWHLDA